MNESALGTRMNKAEGPIGVQGLGTGSGTFSPVFARLDIHSRWRLSRFH